MLELQVHCGFEGAAATGAIRRQLKMFGVGRKGVRAEGPMASDLDLSGARPAVESTRPTWSANWRR